MSISQPVRPTTEPAARAEYAVRAESAARTAPVARTDSVTRTDSAARRRQGRLASLVRAFRFRVAKPYRQVNPRQAQTLVDCGTLVLDVREPQEWEAGHVPGSRNIPLSEVSRRRDELPEVPVLVVDRSGPRSAMAATMLGEQGYEAFDLRGGLRAWDYSGRRLTSADGRAGSIV